MGSVPAKKRLRVFTFRICPTPEQESLLSRHAGCTRFVWNKALDLQKRRLEAQMPLLTYGDTAKLLPLWRERDAYVFLALAPSQSQQQTLKNLDRRSGRPWIKRTPDVSPGSRRRARRPPFSIPRERIST
ncbi:MAG: helix-turn-helix domain-containing protein [Leptospirales bacterium]